MIFQLFSCEINCVFSVHLNRYSETSAMARALTLSETQSAIFQRIANYMAKPTDSINGNVFLLQGPAGSGKTFLLNQIMDHCRKENVKAIAFAYTGIASCLLPKGRTVHSLFRVPWNPQQVSCSIQPESWVYKSIKQASVLVWDQAAYCSRHIIEEINGFLQNMMNSPKLFGGKLVVMSADFLECPPIVSGAAHADEPAESHSLLFSALYSQMQRFNLHENFRFTSPAHFHWCLEIGNGLRNEISVPNECRVYDMDTLIDSIYGPAYAALSTDDIMARSIFTVIADDVEVLNTKCLNQLHPTRFICESINFFRKINENKRSRYYNMAHIMAYLPKYFPSDVLQLTENCPIMLTQSYHGLSAGTRLIVKVRCYTIISNNPGYVFKTIGFLSRVWSPTKLWRKSGSAAAREKP